MISTVVIGSKQYPVSLGQRLRVEKLPLKKGDIWKGEKVVCFFEKNKLTVGEPFIKKACVKARIVCQGKAKKILILKKKRRKGYRRTQGHRQMFTEIFIEGISDPKGEWRYAKKLTKKDKKPKISKTISKSVASSQKAASLKETSSPKKKVSKIQESKK